MSLNSEPVILTPNGDATLRKRLDTLIVSSRIEGSALAAPGIDDLESTDLLDALGHFRRCIKDLQRALRVGQLTTVVEQNEKVAIGTTVVLTCEEGTKTYVIGGYGETDIAKGLLAYTAPLAQAMLGKSVGAPVNLRVEDLDIEWTIGEIRPPSQGYNQLYSKSE